MSSYTPNSQFYDSQFVIRDSSTKVSESSGALIIEGGVAARTTHITGDVSVNDVKITPNLDDVIRQNDIVLTETSGVLNNIYFNNTKTSGLKITLRATKNGQYAIWTINGIYDGQTWISNASFTGDLLSGVDFNIINNVVSNRGEIGYTNSEGGSLTVSYRATTTAQLDTEPTPNDNIIINTSGNLISNGIFHGVTNNTTDLSSDLTYKNNILNATSINTGNVLISNGLGEDYISYPDITMTSASTGGYSVSSSGWGGSFFPYYVFDNNTSTFFHCRYQPLVYNTAGSYISTITTTDINNNVYAGEWLQLQVPTPIVLSGYTIRPRMNNATQAPYTFVVLGSNNGTTWNLLDSKNKLGDWANSVTRNFTLNNKVEYTTYRFVFTETIPNPTGGVFTIAELKLLSGDYRAPMTTDSLTINDYAYYPKINMTSASQGGYVVSGRYAFSFFTYNLFDNSEHTIFSTIYSNNPYTPAYNTTTGEYVGFGGVYLTTTDITGVVYPGEWIQIKLPVAISVYGYDIRRRVSGTGTTTLWSQAPNSWQLFGSNDETNWVLLSSQNFTGYSEVGWDTTRTKRTLLDTPSSEYSVFRLVFPRKGDGAGGVVFSDFRLLTRDSDPRRILLTKNGNVGIGTSAPSSKLHVREVFGSVNSTGTVRLERTSINTPQNPTSIVFRSKRDRATDYGYITYQDTPTPNDTTSNAILKFGTATGQLTEGRGDIIIMNSSGLISMGDGRDPTSAKLHVLGSINNTISSGRYFNSSTSGNSSGTFNVSLYAENYVVSGTGFFAESDVRIKMDISDIHDNVSLSIIRSVQPKTYGYIDKSSRGQDKVYGFIADQIGPIIPNAVKTTTGYIPNIYDRASCVRQLENGFVYLFTLHTKMLQNGLENTFIKIVDPYAREHVVKIESVISSNTFTASAISALEYDEYFVYGQVVDDFKVLNKSAIWTVATAAIQETDRQLQIAKSNLNDKKQRVTVLKEEIDTIKTILHNAGL